MSAALSTVSFRVSPRDCPALLNVLDKPFQLAHRLTEKGKPLEKYGRTVIHGYAKMLQTRIKRVGATPTRRFVVLENYPMPEDVFREIILDVARTNTYYRHLYHLYEYRGISEKDMRRSIINLQKLASKIRGAGIPCLDFY